MRHKIAANQATLDLRPIRPPAPSSSLRKGFVSLEKIKRRIDRGGFLARTGREMKGQILFRLANQLEIRFFFLTLWLPIASIVLLLSLFGVPLLYGVFASFAVACGFWTLMGLMASDPALTQETGD